MHIINLENSDKLDLMRCFNRAFADYFVEMPTIIDYWEKRWEAARVDYSLSFGMLSGAELVGFIINGIDVKNNKLTAFNSGTGVIPSYRGQKIVRQLYDFAIPELRRNGVEACGLEVITKNEKAIKAYKDVGFEISKTLKCYSGILNPKTDYDIKLTTVDFEKIDWEKLPDQNSYSWDNCRNAAIVLKENIKYFEVLEKTSKIGYFIVIQKSGYLMQFDLFPDKDQNDWPKLFAGISKVVAKVKINNIDAHRPDKINAIKKEGLNNYLDQYEMEYSINI